MTQRPRPWQRILPRLLAARARAGLSPAAVSRRCDCSPSTVRKLENGTIPAVTTALAYAEAVGLPLTPTSPHLARLIDLDGTDIAAVLRAAFAATQGHRLTPIQARRAAEALAKVHPATETR